jgi:O-antigen/teichoic acid export membrane protein
VPFSAIRQTNSEISLLRAVVGLGSASIAGYLVMLGAAPIIARLYTPAAVGEAQIILSLGATLSVAASQRYELALPVPTDARIASDLLTATVHLILAFTIFATTVLFIASTQIARLLHLEHKALLALLPLLIVGTAINWTGSFWLTRLGQFGAIALGRLANSVGLVTAQTVLAISFRGSPVGYAAASAIGLTLSILVQQIGANTTLSSLRTPHLSRELAALYAYRNFPFYTLPYTLLTESGKALIITLLGVLDSKRTAGFYAVAYRIVFLPVSLVSASLSQAFYRRATDAAKLRDLEVVVQRMLTLLVKVATPALLLLCIYRTEICRSVLGLQWAGVADYMPALCAPSFVILCTTWLDRLYDIAHKQKVRLIVQVIGDCVAFLAFAVLFLATRDPKLSVYGFCAFTAGFNIVWLLITYRVSGFRFAGLWTPLRAACLTGLASLAVAAAMRAMLGQWQSLFACCMIMCVYYIQVIRGQVRG